MAENQTSSATQAQGVQPQQADLTNIVAAAAAFLAQQIRANQPAHQSAGFKGTTEGKLSVVMLGLATLLLLAAAFFPLEPSIKAKFFDLAEKLFTYVPAAYAVSRGLTKGGVIKAKDTAGNANAGDQS